jgi:hypothetical protein
MESVAQLARNRGFPRVAEWLLRNGGQPTPIPAPVRLPLDYTLYRVGFMSGGHANNIEDLLGASEATAEGDDAQDGRDGDGGRARYLGTELQPELQPAIAHFLLGAAYVSKATLERALGDASVTADNHGTSLEATFVGIETRRLVSIAGGYPSPATGGTVPCVVALFKSAAMAARRAELHAALAAADVPVLELFATGDTYPEGHVYVVLATCIDDAAATKTADALAANRALTSTKQVTRDHFYAVTPHGLCAGL